MPSQRLRMSETQAAKAVKGYFVQNLLFLAYPSSSTLILTTLPKNSFSDQDANPGLRISRLGSLQLHHCCVAASGYWRSLEEHPSNTHTYHTSDKTVIAPRASSVIHSFNGAPILFPVLCLEGHKDRNDHFPLETDNLPVK